MKFDEFEADDAGHLAQRQICAPHPLQRDRTDRRGRRVFQGAPLRYSAD